MDAFFKTPLVEVGKAEEPQTFGTAQGLPNNPNDLKNYASDEKTKNYVQDEVVGVLAETRMHRAPLMEEWNQVRRMELLIHDSGKRYVGRSNYYVPLYNRIQGTLVSSLSRGLFPSDEYMDVIDRGSGDPEKAKPVKQYMQWELERNAHLRSHIKPFIKQYVNYGNSPLKFFYNKQVQHQGRTKRIPDLLKGFRAGPSFGRVTTYDGLCVSPRSIFNWYVYPTTAASLEEATMVFEDTRVPKSYIESMIAKGIYENGEEALYAPEVAEEQSERVQIAEDIGGMGSNSAEGAGRDFATVTLTEVWCFLKLPRSAYFDDEDHNLPIPARVLLAGETPVRITRNPFWHQSPPYLIARKNVHPGFFYGSGYGRIIQNLQYLTNDSANQMKDIGDYTLNPVVKVNPAMLAGTLDPICPGRVWKTMDPNGITFDRPPVELIREASTLMNQYISMGQDFGGAPPMLQGAGGGGGSAKTATGAQILQRNAMTPLQDEVEDIEYDVLIPLLFKSWVNAQQYREEGVMVAVAGEAIRVTPEQLAIDADFLWLASNQAANQQQRAQQGMMFLQALMPLIPYYQAQRKIINFDPILKRVYSSGFGWRGFSEIIQQLPQIPGAVTPMQGDPNAAPGQEQGDRVRSTLEQIGGPGGEMAAGEGEDFMQVRSEADDLAGMLGGLQ